MFHLTALYLRKSIRRLHFHTLTEVAKNAFGNNFKDNRFFSDFPLFKFSINVRVYGFLISENITVKRQRCFCLHLIGYGPKKAKISPCLDSSRFLEFARNC